MHLIMMWRDETPKDWQPIAPGMDPRIVCDVPVDFGDPDDHEGAIGAVGCRPRMGRHGRQ
jgi:hypothetical protein